MLHTKTRPILRAPFKQQCNHPNRVPVSLQGALILKIIRGKYPPISSSYSKPLSEMLDRLLDRDTRIRPRCDGIFKAPAASSWASTLAIPLPGVRPCATGITSSSTSGADTGSRTRPLSAAVDSNNSVKAVGVSNSGQRPVSGQEKERSSEKDIYRLEKLRMEKEKEKEKFRMEKLRMEKAERERAEKERESASHAAVPVQRQPPSRRRPLHEASPSSVKPRTDGEVAADLIRKAPPVNRHAPGGGGGGEIIRPRSGIKAAGRPSSASGDGGGRIFVSPYAAGGAGMGGFVVAAPPSARPGSAARGSPSVERGASYRQVIGRLLPICAFVSVSFYLSPLTLPLFLSFSPNLPEVDDTKSIEILSISIPTHPHQHQSPTESPTSAWCNQMHIRMLENVNHPV